MHRGFALWTLVCLSGLGLLIAGCASNTAESEAPATPASGDEATEPASAEPAAESDQPTDFGVDMQMEVDEQEEPEPARNNTPPPTRAYRPENKPAQSQRPTDEKAKE
jgi:hypothetical protein